MMDTATERRLDLGDRWSLRAITGGAMIFAAIGLLSLVVRTIPLLGSAVIDVAGMVIQPGAIVPGLADSTAIAAAEYETALLSVVDAPWAARAWLVAETASSILLTVGLCAIVAFVGMKLLAGRPFARTATLSIMTAAILVVVTGTLGQLFGALARAEIVDYLGAAGNDFYLFLFNFDPAPLAYGFALAVIAGAFQLGERMQRDTEGLV